MQTQDAVEGLLACSRLSVAGNERKSSLVFSLVLPFFPSQLPRARNRLDCVETISANVLLKKYFQCQVKLDFYSRRLGPSPSSVFSAATDPTGLQIFFFTVLNSLRKCSSVAHFRWIDSL